MQANWTHDDLMNCYRAFENSWSTTLRDIVTFWKPSNQFRPLGQVLYKIGFQYSDLNIWPWRLVVSSILILNAFLLGHLATKLSGSLAFGLTATAIASYHYNWPFLYLNTGTIYEILAFTFVYAGLACFVEFRDKPWVLPATALLYILGLNAKESVVVLPVFLVLYDFLWHRRIDWKVFALFGGITLAFIFGRVYGLNGISSIGLYKPDYKLSVYLERFRGYLSGLILWEALPLWAAPLVAATPFLLRTRMSTFAALVFPIGILPLAFVPDRGLEGVYIACAGLALSLPCLLLLIPKEKLRLLCAALLFAAMFLWVPAKSDLSGADVEYGNITNFYRELKVAAPTLPPGSQIRFLREPFLAHEHWASTFASRLLYRDPSLEIVCLTNPNLKDKPTGNDYAVFEWSENRMLRIK